MNAPFASPEVVSANFRSLMRQFPATVTVITGRHDGVDHGMTATAVTSVCMDPPALLVCLNNRTYLHDMLSRQPEFAVNVLADPEVRAQLPRYSNWPTFPQLFIDGELIGGRRLWQGRL